MRNRTDLENEKFDESGNVKMVNPYDDTILAMKSTIVGGITYVATAAPGSAISAAVWRCKKVDENTAGTILITWSDGNTNFDNVATNLATLSYS